MKNIILILSIVLIPAILYAGIRLTQGRLEDFQVDGVSSSSTGIDYDGVWSVYTDVWSDYTTTWE